MKIVKNLSKANIKKYEGFERREDLDFSDDGAYFKGFSYKGMPITTVRSRDITYLCVRVDYLENEFTYKDWMNTEEYKLCDMFNGVSEFDIDELIENIEAIMVKVAEMNEAVMNEEIDMTNVEVAIANEIEMATNVVNNFKANCKWYNVPSHKLATLVRYMKSTEEEIARVKAIKVSELTKKQKREMIQRLDEYGYVKIRKDGFYLRAMMEAIKTY